MYLGFMLLFVKQVRWHGEFQPFAWQSPDLPHRRCHQLWWTFLQCWWQLPPSCSFTTNNWEPFKGPRSTSRIPTHFQLQQLRTFQMELQGSEAQVLVQRSFVVALEARRNKEVQRPQVENQSTARPTTPLTQHPLCWDKKRMMVDSVVENSRKFLNWGTSSPFSGKRELSFLNCPWCPNHTESNSHQLNLDLFNFSLLKICIMNHPDLPSSLPIKPKINPHYLYISTQTNPSYQRSNMLKNAQERQACSISSSPVRNSKMSPSGSELWILSCGMEKMLATPGWKEPISFHRAGRWTEAYPTASSISHSTCLKYPSGVSLTTTFAARILHNRSHCSFQVVLRTPVFCRHFPWLRGR